MNSIEYGASTEVDLPFECALTRTREALQEHGLAVVSEAHVDGSRSVILGLGAPGGDVIVYEDVCGGVTIAAAGGEDIGARLDAVMDWLRPCAVR